MASCRTHENSFTVYPPGWTPFSRRIVVLVSPAGFDVAPTGTDLDDWSDTVFGAAVDAAASCRSLIGCRFESPALPI